MPAQCPYCNKSFPKTPISSRHKGSCQGWVDASIAGCVPCLCGHRESSDNKLKAHKKTCEIWQARDKNAVRRERLIKTNTERFGAASPIENPEIRARIAATNRERYGAENPFAREASTFDAVQASLEGKRPILHGADNPFARGDVKVKIRESMLERHGVANPQQSPEIRARTKATSEERYGGVLLSSPVLAEKARETNLAIYGDVIPQRTEAVKAKQRETNMSRYGVPWTSMDPVVRAKQLEAHHAKWGSHYFASEEGKEEILRVVREKYGADHWMQTPGAWDKMKSIFREKFGVEHPLQLAEFLDKQRETLIQRYGNPFPGLRGKGPNGLESAVLNLSQSRLLFTGDGQFWKRLPKIGRYKNADFIVPGPDVDNPKNGVKKVVEAFGDFWHSRIFTGKAPFDHEQELIDAYAEIGIECLIVWESEVYTDEAKTRERLERFLAGTR
jgi:hypothetical protein